MISKTKTVTFYKKKLDAVFSRFIRARDDGQCYTCNKKDEWKRMQNGHFVPRQYLSVRYSEVNCHCQCYACNMLYNGQPSRYAQKLKQQYGDGIIDELERERQKITKLDVSWYLEKIKYYEEQVAKYTTVW